jgi:hypothetical protein
VSGARVAGHPADGSKNFVCDVLLPERAVSYQANARLIAAAPDMLEALQNLENDDGSSMPDSAWKLVQDAIAKATGGAA